jgi:beta-mannosidase
MSEYGFQSFPEFRTVQAYAAPGDYDIFSEVMKAHQRSSIGNGTIKTYMERDYKVPGDFRQFLYVGQVLQAEGIKMAMEGHRARMPYCMGSLFWQINDCWPVASWSSIDYFGRWKAQQYYARKSFAPVLVTASLMNGTVDITLVNDPLADLAAVLELKVMDFHGYVRKTVTRDVVVKANGALQAFTAPETELLAGLAPETVLLRAKDLILPKPVIDTHIRTAGKDVLIGLSSPALVKNLYLSHDTVDGTWSDNYFDLLPGQAAVVRFTPAKPVAADAVRHGLRLMHMAEVV